MRNVTTMKDRITVNVILDIMAMAKFALVRIYSAVCLDQNTRHGCDIIFVSNREVFYSPGLIVIIN